MTTRYSVTFALLPRPLRDGTHSVALTVTWCRQRYRHTLAVSCPPDSWDAARQLARPRGTFRDVAAVNSAVLDTRQQVDDLFTRLAADGRTPTPHDLDGLLTATKRLQDRMTVADAIAAFMEEQQRERGWQPATAAKFAMLRRELIASGTTYADEIDDAARARFIDLHTAHGLRNTTLAKKVAILNWFLRWSNGHGYTSCAVKPLHLRTVPRAVTYLEWDELMHLYSFDYGDHAALSHVRDIFCLCAFTGLRYSDAAALRWHDVTDDSLRVVTQKTADPLDIPLNKYARAIIEKYRGTQGRVLHAPTNQAANRLLKDAALLAQLDRTVRQVFFRGNERHEEALLLFEDFTTHYARRTFVVHALRLGIPSEVITRFTGHNSLQAMKPYVAIVDELKATAMHRFDEV